MTVAEKLLVVGRLDSFETVKPGGGMRLSDGGRCGPHRGPRQRRRDYSLWQDGKALCAVKHDDSGVTFS